MLGRIVFLYFIQKKGWLAVPAKKNKNNTSKNEEIDWGTGDQDFLFNLFQHATYKESFYADYLVPLFFNTLNNPDGKLNLDKKLFNNPSAILTNNNFPYLNGGLFDKTQDFKYDKIVLPSKIFEKLFTTFNEYNFTIYEDAPDEQTVAVDPEMLGHIFENLLEDNKDKGAFYTPKDIVHYMCRESLHNYIYTYTQNQNNNDFKQRLKQYNDTYDISLFSKDEIKKIDRALEDVKICDPAIGSGAFPMGLLHEIYHLKIPIEDVKGFKAKSPANLKKHIIEESIYGIDIDNGAVDIARLRFWLSLVVDDVKPQPLPNLAFKIVCANTLIPLGTPKGDLSGSHEIAKQIETIREVYFNASKEDKKDLERQFKELQNKLWTTAKDWVSKEDAEIYHKISEFNPFEDKSCSWFDPWWMFGIKDGFDIVIGNPPYVIPTLSKENREIYKSLYKSALYQINLYLLFVEKGSFLLKKNGVLSYIIPNTWLVNKAVTEFRKLLISKFNILSIVDLTSEDIFDATVLPIILFLTISKENENDISIYKVFNDEFNYLKNLKKSDIKNDENYLINYQISDVNKFIIENIEGDNVPLSHISKISFGAKFYQVNKGKPKQTRDIVDNHSYTHKNAINNNCLKILEGKNVDRYSINFGEEYIEYGEWLAEPRRPEMFEGERILLGRIVGKKGLISTYVNEKYCNNSLLHIVKPFNINYNSKFILSILNSNLIGFYFISKYARNEKTFPEIRIHELEKLPIKENISDTNQIPFITLVDYLLYLHNKENLQVISHTENICIASQIEDVLNMMVYELYFEEHMKEVGIDVLQFIDPKPIYNLKNDTEKVLAIKSFYNWLQSSNNPVKERIQLANTLSENLIGLINKSI